MPVRSHLLLAALFFCAPSTSSARVSHASGAKRSATLRDQGIARMKLEDNVGALKLLRQAKSLEPDNADNLHALATCLSKMELFPEAAKDYRRFLELAPNAPDASTIKEELENYDAAQAEPPASGEREFPDELISRAKEKLGAHDGEGAIALLIRAEKLEPNNAEIERILGETLERMNRLSEAVPHFRKFIALVPSSPAAPRIRKVISGFSTKKKRR